MSCELCGSQEITFLSHAVVSPWIVKLIDPKHTYRSSSLLLCRTCGFQYFSDRYNDSEMAAIYSAYRGEEYFHLRHSFEPWFTRSSMDSWNPKSYSERVNLRRDYMFSFLRKNGVQLNTIENVLDFGGDLGQFFPDESTGDRYLIDPANQIDRHDGIKRIEKIEVLNKKCGLIMNCHTLEHIPDLSGTVTGMSAALRKGGYLYIEVPADMFRLNKIHSTYFYFRYLDFLTRIKVLFVALDFLTGVYRTFTRRIPSWGIVKQSEHINYFQKGTLEKLISGTGMRVLAISDPDYDFGQGFIRLGRISLLATRD